MTKITKEKYIGDNLDASPIEILEETIETDNDDRIFELEKHLHEQYAINNNSNAGTLVSLIGSLLVVMTGYGYVLYQYRICQCDDTAIVNLAAIIAMAVMMLLYCISVSLGANQRMEQFITFAIRAKHYKADRYKEIFPKGYLPFKKGYCKFVQGLYNIWTKVMLLAIIVIAMSHYYLADDVGIVIFFGGLFILSSQMFRCYKYKKYIEREYSEYNKHSSFIEEIEQDESKLCVCNIACYTTMCVVMILLMIFFINNLVFDRDRYNRENINRELTINVNYNDITKQNK